MPPRSSSKYDLTDLEEPGPSENGDREIVELTQGLCSRRRKGVYLNTHILSIMTHVYDEGAAYHVDRQSHRKNPGSWVI